MNLDKSHYTHIIRKQRGTRFASCGYKDRFDPFELNKNKHLRDLYSGLFRSYLTDIPTDRLLDVGCGTGIYFDVLAGFAGKIEAVDISEDMINIARGYCREQRLALISPKVGSVEALEYNNEFFDVVTSIDLIHHVMDPDRAINEIHRVLKQGGHLFVFEPNVFNPLMFLAHLIPKEERLALGRSRPAKLAAALEDRFELIRWEGICAMVTQCKGIRRFVFDAYLKACRLTRLKKLYPRQVCLARKN